MLVVSDASPLIVLIRLSMENMLPSLFGRVVVPGMVASELRAAGGPEIVRKFAAQLPVWLEIREPQVVSPIAGLDKGELAAIALAQEMDADLLLIDEKRGRHAATDLHLKIVGTIGILEMAAAAELLDLNEVFLRLAKTDFRISDAILKDALAREAVRRARNKSK